MRLIQLTYLQSCSILNQWRYQYDVGAVKDKPNCLGSASKASLTSFSNDTKFSGSSFWPPRSGAPGLYALSAQIPAVYHSRGHILLPVYICSIKSVSLHKLDQIICKQLALRGFTRHVSPNSLGIRAVVAIRPSAQRGL
jgi:hypothetical protein